MGIESLTPSAWLLAAGVLLDGLFGDPRLPQHPIRLLGRTLAASEAWLRRRGWDGYGGGCLLFLILAGVWVVLPSLAVGLLAGWSPVLAAGAHVLIVYSLLALRDLVDHVRAVDRAAGRNDLDGAKEAVGLLVGRDTARMDLAACRRAAIESLSENFVDGFLSPIFWYALLGLPGLLLFKVVSTMDSMVGYKTPPYLRFGWCGARLDDLMNYVPARIAWLVLGLSALPWPRLRTLRGWRTGWRQHGILPGPNPGWSEATMAGLLGRRLVGPIWRGGVRVTEVWLGDPADPPAGSSEDLRRALGVVAVASAAAVAAAAAAIGAWS